MVLCASGYTVPFVRCAVPYAFPLVTSYAFFSISPQILLQQRSFPELTSLSYLAVFMLPLFPVFITNTFYMNIKMKKIYETIIEEQVQS